MYWYVLWIWNKRNMGNLYLYFIIFLVFGSHCMKERENLKGEIIQGERETVEVMLSIENCMAFWWFGWLMCNFYYFSCDWYECCICCGHLEKEAMTLQWRWKCMLSLIFCYLGNYSEIIGSSRAKFCLDFNFNNSTHHLYQAKRASSSGLGPF